MQSSTIPLLTRRTRLDCMPERACAAGAPTLTAPVLTRPPHLGRFAATFQMAQCEAIRAATEALEAEQATARRREGGGRIDTASARRKSSALAPVRRLAREIMSRATQGCFLPTR